MARGNWTHHTGNCQEELLRLLQEAGGKESLAGLYRRGAWGIRTQTVKALIRKGKIACSGADVWNGDLILSPDVAASTLSGENKNSVAASCAVKEEEEEEIS